MLRIRRLDWISSLVLVACTVPTNSSPPRPSEGGSGAGNVSGASGSSSGVSGSFGASGASGAAGFGVSGTGGTDGVSGASGAGGGIVGVSGSGSSGSTGQSGSTGSSGSGSSGSGNASACNLTGSPAAASGSFTWYYFGQGTPQTNGKFQTACGYLGTESGMTDTVANIAQPSYFAAIPGSNNFNTSNHCGGCVEISNAGRSVIATIIDECPTDNGQNAACQRAGHLDISWKAWNDLGYAVGNPSGTTWRFVPCPVTGNVIIRFKSNNNNQEIYIENEVVPIASASADGMQGSRTFYGTWHFGSPLFGGQTLTLTDAAGRTISFSISSTNADQDQNTGKQFPPCQ